MTGVTRTGEGVELRCADGRTRRFDDVVIAAHADDALALLQTPTRDERRLLGAFPYLENAATLHTDARAMPKRRAAWASWNYLAEGEGVARRVFATYWMNRLQSLPGRENVFLSLNNPRPFAEGSILRRVTYRHPLFNAASFAAQRELWSLQGEGGVWFCGAYFGYGFHEDGLQAGLAVAEAIDDVRRPWRVQGESDRLVLMPARPRAEAL